MRSSIPFIPFLASFVVLLSSAQAQDTTNLMGRVSIASPTAASLGKYGDIPVSYHTGIPDITIPVYSIKSGSLQLPVSLSYHAGGIKVLESASWVGAGWSLNAGGVITRTVVGGADDRGLAFNNLLYGHYTDYGYNHYYSQQDQGTVDLNMTRGLADGEPDLYFFNFGGYTGKFYFNDDRTPMLIPEQDFKIEPFFTAWQGFTGFIITTPDGTKYFFGQKGNNNTAFDPIEITNSFTVQSGPSNTTVAASSWFLNKIMSADGVDSITFKYQKEDYSYYTVATIPTLDYQYLQTGSSYDKNYGMNLVKNLTQGARLTEIDFANGQVLFTKAATPRADLSSSAGIFATQTMTDYDNTNSYALGSITITDGNGFCKKDSLFTSYFQDLWNGLPGSSSDFWYNYTAYNLHTDESRLRLDSIQETSCNAAVQVPPYRFTYFDDRITRRLSFGVDHWGYANGATGNTTLVPTITKIVGGTSSTIPGGNRDGAWPAMRAGTLQTITYPTGGSTTLDFEPKNIYDFPYSVFEVVHLTRAVAHLYGQSTLSQTLPFTVVSGGGDCVFDIEQAWTPCSGCANVPDASPMLSIKNSSGTEIYNTGYISPTSYTFNRTLTPGDYTVTIYYQGVSNSINCGAYAEVGQYQYVPHDNYQTVGGLRIKTITNKDALTSNDVVTSYNYTGGGSSTTGTLYSIPVYVQVIRNDVYRNIWGATTSANPNGCASIDGVNQHTAYYSAGSIRPMATVQGENFGYNEVDVSQTGNGHSVYRYYGSNLWSQNITDVCVRSVTHSSLCSTSIPNYPAPPLPFEFMRDEPSYEGYFNEGGQVLKEVYHFPTYVADPIVTPGHIGINIPSFVSFTEYTLQTAKKVSDSTVTTVYDRSSGNNGTITTLSATYYGSNFHHRPTQTASFNSKGERLVSNTKYAMDFRISSCDAIPDSLSYYQNAIHNDSTWMYSNMSSCTPQTNDYTNCRLFTYSQFRSMLAQHRQNFVRYRRNSYANDSANLLNSCYLAAQGSADGNLGPVLRLQQEYNNASIEVSQFKNGNLQGASFTKYDNSTFPTGFAYPGKTQLISLQAPSLTFINASVSSNTIAKDSRYLDETSMLFNSGNLLQATAHDGVTTSFVWDYQSKKPIAKVVNATQDQVAYTSFEADGGGGWTIGSPLRASGAITGLQSYSLANGACSRSGLTASSTYILSYWSRSGSNYTVSGSTNVKQGKTITINSVSWTYFEHTVTGVLSVSVSGNNGIDELRLYPLRAQMVSYCYSPLLGTINECDINNRITYYNYDALGRLSTMRDQDGNVVKTIDYHYAGQ